jgi:transposase
VSRDIQRRQEGLPKAIIDRAWDAQLRLCRRFRKLLARGKERNVAAIAVARELAGFIWDIGRLGMAQASPAPESTA